MKFVCGLLIGVFVSHFSWAQQILPFVNGKDSSKVSISLYSRFEGNSNTMPNAMLRKILWGGYMSPSFLTEMRDKLNEKGNRFGYEFNNKIEVCLNKQKYDWTIGVKYRELLGLNFSKDLFGVAFLGNAAYEGVEANVSDTKYQYWQYSSIDLGITKQWDSTTTGNLSIGFLYGLNYQKITTGQAGLYTAPDGEYLKTKADMQLAYKEPSAGLGLAINANFKKEWGSNYLFFAIEDLGLIQWQKVTRFEGSSSTEYKGERIDNLSNFTGDSLFSDFTVRGFGKRFGIQESSGSQAVLMPFAATVRYGRLFSTKWRASLEGYYTYMPAYIPKMTARIIRTLPKDLNLSAGLAYGGFGRQNFLLGVGKTFASNWSIQAEAYFLGIAFLPNHTHGVGLNFSLRKGF